jgi:hypothetical protein
MPVDDPVTSLLSMSYRSKSNFPYFFLGFGGFCTYLYEIIKKKEYGIQIRQSYGMCIRSYDGINGFGLYSGIK